MTVDFPLPELGDGVAEAEVMSWLVEEGAAVAEHQPLVEVQTDKAMVEITAPVTGVLQKHVAAVGQMVKTDEVIATFAADGADPAPETAARPTTAAAPTAVTAPTASEPADDPSPPTPSPDTDPPRRPLAAPTVRKLARELDIELAQVEGTGPGGRVTRTDLEAFRSNGAAAAAPAGPSPTGTAEERERPTAPPVTAEEGTQRVPLRGLRRTIARRMTETLRTVPHVTGLLEIDVTALQDLLEELRPTAQAQGSRLTWTTFFALATIQALQEFPQLNASLDDEREEIVLHERIHLGVATATDDGLLVPVVRNADRLSVLELASEVGRVSKAARDRTAAASELTGSTFTITNYGAVGGWHGTPMVNLPEIGIVGFGSVEPRPAVVDGQLAVRTTVALSHTVDHRLIDGAINARFGAAIRRRLEEPNLLLLGVARGHG